MTDSPDDPVDRFVLALVGGSRMFTGLIDDLTEMLPTDAYPGKEPHQVVLEMLSGTIHSALDQADPAQVTRAAHLIDQATDRVFEHLRLAVALSDRIGPGRPGGRGYG